MKKLLLIPLTPFFLSSPLFALPLGNPIETTILYRCEVCDEDEENEEETEDPCTYFECFDWLGGFYFRMGFYGDYVFNRKMVTRNQALANAIERTKIFTNAGYFVANYHDFLDLFATLGGTNIIIDTNALTFPNIVPPGRITIESGSGFSWSLGARYFLIQCASTAVSLEGQFFEVHPDVKRITYNDSVSSYTDDFLDMKYMEYQFGVGVSQTIGWFIPYTGIKWANSVLFFHNDIGPVAPLRSLKSQLHFGWVLGVSAYICDRGLLTVETRFFDEKALHVNGQFRF